MCAWLGCRIQNEGSFFSLTGKLEEPWTGAASHAGAAQEHRKEKKRRAEAAAAAARSGRFAGAQASQHAELPLWGCRPGPYPEHNVASA